MVPSVFIGCEMSSLVAHNNVCNRSQVWLQVLPRIHALPSLNSGLCSGILSWEETFLPLLLSISVLVTATGINPEDTRCQRLHEFFLTLICIYLIVGTEHVPCTFVGVIEQLAGVDSKLLSCVLKTSAGQCLTAECFPLNQISHRISKGLHQTHRTHMELFWVTGTEELERWLRG